jgi:hypothetical protein
MLVGGADRIPTNNGDEDLTRKRHSANLMSIGLVRKLSSIRVLDTNRIRIRIRPPKEKIKPAEPLAPIHSFNVGFRATIGGAAK